MILASAHSPRRPGWTCRGCGLPYPCPEGRRRLAAAHRQDGQLGIVAYELLTEAVRDLPELSVTDLFDRFVAWTDPGPVRVTGYGAWP